MAVNNRCPHCASTKIADGICFTCARSISEEPDLPRIDGLEDTFLEAPRERVRTPVETNDTTMCMYCGVPNPDGRSLCLACGQRL